MNLNKPLLLVMISCLAVLVKPLPSQSQDKLSSNAVLNLPPLYYTLTTDAAKIYFLEGAIKDSLDNGQLTHVYEWAKLGLHMAEKNAIDSMEGIFNFYIAKSYAYGSLLPDSAIVYYKKVLPYFPDKMRKYNIFSVRGIMESYSEQGNKDSTFKYLDSLNALIDTMPYSSPKRVSLSQNIATVYQWFGMFKTAIRYFQIAVNGERENGNKRGLGLALANLGELYSESGDDIKANQFSREALVYLEGVNMPYIGTAINIATYFTSLGQYDSAMVYLNKAEKIARQVNDVNSLNIIGLALGDIYLGRKKFPQARAQLEKSLADLKEGGDRWNLTKAYMSLARLDTSLGNFQDAKINLLEGLNIAREDKQQVLSIDILENLAIVYAKLNDYSTAFEYQHEFLVQQDSLTSEKTKNSLADLEISYQTQQKEKKIKDLQVDNDLKKLQLINGRQSFYFYIVAFSTLILISGIFYYQRSHRNKLKTEKMKAELQTQVLRSQMNPHFIFNSLNSIENYIMQNDKRKASDYLNKFSRLIRSILDSSRNEMVPIEKDMEALNLYVELEQLRFNNKFIYKESLDSSFAGGDYRVPSLLIQPYVENAIIHGIAHSEQTDLHLSVTAALVDDKIKYTIQDNGIGRDKAASYNRLNKPFHKSIGLKITEDRIRLFNDEQVPGSSVIITDLYDEDHNPDGTKVEITIKAI